MKQYYVIKRDNGFYYFVINVPKSCQDKFKQKQIWRSLRTKDEAVAAKNAAKHIDQWRSWFESDPPEDQLLDYASIKSCADKRGFTYIPFKQICEASTEDSIRLISGQIEALKFLERANKVEVAAIVGALEIPRLRMDEFFRRFQELSPDKVHGTNAAQKSKKWRRLERVTLDFTKRMPEISDVLMIESCDAFEYRARLVRAVNAGEFLSDLAKKNIRWLKSMFDVVLGSDHPHHSNPFDKLPKIDIDDASKRKAFTALEVQEIKKRMWSSAMSEDAKSVILLGELTGCSVKELILLEKDDIDLDGPIPHIVVRPNSSRGKVKRGGTRHRAIPLLGDALETMKKHPCGFGAYREPNGPDRMNRAMSDFFKKVVPGKGHYSFRHRFDDLLKNSGCDIGLKCAIMGHSLKGHGLYYGEGYELELKLIALQNAQAFALPQKEKENNNMALEANKI